MNSSFHRYLSCWPRSITTAHLQDTILTYYTKGRLRRRSSVAIATRAPGGIIPVTPQLTLPTHLRVKKESITTQGCKSSIFVDDARNMPLSLPRRTPISGLMNMGVQDDPEDQLENHKRA